MANTEAFTRLAEKRVNMVLDGYRKLSNLGSKQYGATMEQKRELITALRKGLDELEIFYGGEKADKKVFKFSYNQTEEEE